VGDNELHALGYRLVDHHVDRIYGEQHSLHIRAGITADEPYRVPRLCPGRVVVTLQLPDDVGKRRHALTLLRDLLVPADLDRNEIVGVVDHRGLEVAPDRQRDGRALARR
jgi:hypothetical protein